MEVDEIGKETLEVISEAKQFNKWMFSTIQNYCSGQILEIGSGLGNISCHFIANNYSIHLSDLRSNYCDYLKENFCLNSNVLGVVQIDLVHPNFDREYSSHIGRYDTVFALNVIEHIEDDHQAILNCRKLLKIGGNLILLVPAYNGLMNQLDENLGHYRRYTVKQLACKVKEANLEIVHKQYFNFVGVLGWYMNGKLGRPKSIPGNQMKLFNKMTPIFKLIDSIVLNKSGLSAIVISKK